MENKSMLDATCCKTPHDGMQLPRGVSLSSLILRPFNATNVRRPDVGI